MERKEYIIAIDLGSSNVTVAVSEKNDKELLDVVSIVQKKTDGVKAGLIENIEQVGKAIHEAVSEVEEELGIRITEAYAGISGEFVRCARHKDHVFVYDPQNGVCHKDIEALFDRMRNVQAPDDETIMERVPQNYLVDDNEEVPNPQGAFCKKLSSTFNFILCEKTPLQRLEMALKRQNIKMLGVMSDALVTPESVLSPDEKEEGVAVVNIGSGLTDVTVYYRNLVRYIATIPMGASAINRDIRTMSVPEKYVESLKRKYGSAVADMAPEDILIRVNGRTSREAKDILLRNLATVIEARATDIAEFVLQEIQDSGFYERLAFGIVLTGGSAKLKNIDELFHRVTSMDVRIACPEMGFSEEALDRLDDPSYATVAGILLRGAQLGASSFMVDRPAPEPVEPPQPAYGRPQQPQPGYGGPMPQNPMGGAVPPMVGGAAAESQMPHPAQQPRQPQPQMPRQPFQPQQPQPQQFQPQQPQTGYPYGGGTSFGSGAAYGRPEMNYGQQPRFGGEIRMEPESETRPEPSFEERQPVDEPSANYTEESTTEQNASAGEQAPEKHKRNLGSLVFGAISRLNNKFNESFRTSEDEEI